MEFHHVSVLLHELVDLVFLNPDGIYVDMTLGGGGHSEEILKRLKNGRLIGIDQDENAIEASQKRLASYKDKFIAVKSNFSEIKTVLENLGIDEVDGIIGDLGVSSPQLDEGERGFSYMQSAPLDMRMDQSRQFSAYDVVNTYTEKQLSDLILAYGEERWAKRIAKFIVSERPIQTTGELVDVIKKAVPKGAREDGPHPAKRTFQAIRIEVNNELGVLKNVLKDGVDCLKSGGKMGIITFHSLEDRIVKQGFAQMEHPCTCPKEFPVCVCGKKPMVKVLTRKAIEPTKEEVERNPRARSAKVRGIIKI